jgi:hypothetical protein
MSKKIRDGNGSDVSWELRQDIPATVALNWTLEGKK